MNERFKELAKQAGAHVSIRNLMSNPPQQVETVELWDDRIEKFAELLIVKCANFVENIFDDDGGHATCEDYAKGIKKYFGVEE